MNFWRAWTAPLLRWRDRLLANPDFQRRSLRLPLVRVIARRRMRALFDLCSGFVYSQVLLACTRLGLLQLLAKSPVSAFELADILELPRDSMDRLLEAAESLKLVERRHDQRWALGSLGAALLGNPGVLMMIEHHSAFYTDLNDPVALLRGEQQTTALSNFWAYSRSADPTLLPPDSVARYSDLMAASQALIAEQVLSSYPLDRHRRLLDVGGGAGEFAAAAMDRHPKLQARVFDLPSVCERALERFGSLGFGERSGACGGNFLTDPLPSGNDLVSLIRVLHDHDDEAVLHLLRTVRQAMPDEGTLLIAEPMLNTRGAEPVTAAYFGFYLMAMGQGRPRSAAELRSMLHEAGFGQVKEHSTSAPLLARTLTARPVRRSSRGCISNKGFQMPDLSALAVVFEAPEQLEVRQLPLTPPGDDDVVVDIDFSGISTGTERLIWTGQMPSFPGMGYPLVPGYESVGRVVEAGSKSGGRVGQYLFVPGARCYGDVRGLFGGAASRLVVPGKRTLVIDEGLAELGVLLALAATAHNAIRSPEGGYRAPELIVGHGVLGRLLARLTAAIADKAPVVWEIDPRRRLGQYGYPVIEPDADPEFNYRSICDVSGAHGLLDALIARLAPGGEVVLAGFYQQPLQFSFPPAFMRQARLRVAAEWQGSDLAEVYRLVRNGQLSLDGLLTHSQPANRAQHAYQTAFSDPDCLKMVLDWKSL